VNVEAGMTPPRDLLHHLRIEKLLLQQKSEDPRLKNTAIRPSSKLWI